jgi:2-(1,2-epoxy-1,2-dihydrophenyl)acetyl-CoA isomerase
MTSFVLLEKSGTIATLTLNRPERHNSLIPELLEQLLTHLETIDSSPDVRVVIQKANGRSFSTGGDVLEFYNHWQEITVYANNLLGLLNSVIEGLMNLSVPVIAAVHSIVTGGSLGLVLAADIIIVTPNTSFTPYYAEVGFSPDGGWTAILSYHPSLVQNVWLR